MYRFVTGETNKVRMQSQRNKRRGAFAASRVIISKNLMTYGKIMTYNIFRQRILTDG